MRVRARVRAQVDWEPHSADPRRHHRRGARARRCLSARSFVTVKIVVVAAAAAAAASSSLLIPIISPSYCFLQSILCICGARTRRRCGGGGRAGGGGAAAPCSGDALNLTRRVGMCRGGRFACPAPGAVASMLVPDMWVRPMIA